MVDAEEKVRAEKIAAAKKRVEQMKKNKKKGAASKKTKQETATEAPPPSTDEVTSNAPSSSVDKPVEDTPKEKADDKAKETVENEPEQHLEEPAKDDSEEVSPSATPSLALQSKMRSTSFRAGSIPSARATSPVPFSPDGDTAPEIYRKHVAKIEELERENKRLAKEASDSEKRWQKAEEELADLRDGDDDSENGDGDAQVNKLKTELASLQRQNAQLQQQVSRGSAHGHGHRPSLSVPSPPAELRAELDSKTATIESMEIEISKLKAQVERHASGTFSEKEQIAALEEKLARAEAAAGKAQRELQDLKRNLDRTAEKAVREGSERTSAETKVKTLEQELEAARNAKAELEKKVEGLEKKATTLTTLHKEQDSRLQALKREKEKAERDVSDLRSKLEKLETRSRKSTEGGGLDDEGVDELEDEVRTRLERKVQALEAELHELRSGQWIGKRRELEATSPGFHDVDLSSGYVTSPAHRKQGGIGDFLTSGLNALAGGGDDEFLDDDGMDFDEDAFRKAQEEESKKRIERIKEIKRSLKHWEGWRLDIVEHRRGGNEGVGEIFDV